MKLKIYAALALLATAIATSGCANTIRGFGQDAANTVNATEHAGKKVANAAN
jgi:entericidin B